MSKFRSALVVAVAVAAGAIVGAVKTEAKDEGCSNTWCAPDDKTCSEVTNWYCELSGGCVGAHKCAGQME